MEPTRRQIEAVVRAALALLRNAVDIRGMTQVRKAYADDLQEALDDLPCGFVTGCEVPDGE